MRLMLIHTIFLSVWLATAAELSTGISSPQPIPDSFEINTIVSTPELDEEILLANRRRVLELRKQVRALRYKHFSSNASDALQARGIEQIARMSDPLAPRPTGRGAGTLFAKCPRGPHYSLGKPGNSRPNRTGPNCCLW